MGNAGRNGGQYYTFRPLIRAMIAVTDSQVGETVYDGAAGSCGFLCEAHGYTAPQLEDLSKLVHGEDSDLIDVLNYVAYHKDLVPRLDRAEQAKI
ncbi:MAG: type I restriction-modification system DNA methylase subunit [Candidatus Azotimanducaceae bacterium]|jgi:type I restriction-modification system DNA methylase subunit